MNAQNTTPNVAKVTRRGVKMNFEGKIPFKKRVIMRLTSSSFWIDRVWYLARFILMVGISFVIIYPFISKVLTSLMPVQDFADPTVNLIPKNPNFEIYTELAKYDKYLTTILTTTLLSGSMAILQTFVACMVGYGLAKFKFKGNKLVMIFVIITMAVQHRTLLLSLSQFFKEFDLFTIQALNYTGPIEAITGSTLYLADSPAPFIMLSATGLAFKNGLYIFMMRQFFRGVPDELEESAYVDGSGSFRTFIQIILPLSIPMMITIFLFAFSWQWTDSFYTTLFYPTEHIALMPSLVDADIPKTLQPMAAGRELFLVAVRNAGGMMVIAPLLVVYLFFQRYLVQGIERSGIVG
jgi:multiple sugar transport system permease protein